MTTFDRDNPRWCVAVHESCHGIAALESGTTFYSLEVDDNNKTGRIRHVPPSPDGNLSFALSDLPERWKNVREFGITPPLDLVKRKLIVGLAPSMGTVRLLGVRWGCGGDFADAEAWLNLMPKKQRQPLYRECEREADRIVNHLYPYLVLTIASCLYDKSPLYLKEIHALLRQCGPRGVRLLNNLDRIKTE
jgi:hypothetical protein